MSESDRDKKIDELLEVIRKAPALNGGFTKISDAVNDIKDSNIKVLFELQSVKNKQDKQTAKIEELSNALYNPDTGLYHRVSEAVNRVGFQKQSISIVMDKANLLETTNQILADKLAGIEIKQEALKNIAGENLEDLRDTITARKNMLRITWLVITGLTAGIAKFLWDVIPNLF